MDPLRLFMRPGVCILGALDQSGNVIPSFHGDTNLFRGRVEIPGNARRDG